MTPASLTSLSYLKCGVSCIQCEMRMAYATARNAEMLFRTSESSITVSLNPGVSIKTTGCPSTRNGGETCISEVHERRPFPTTNASVFVARFTNWLTRRHHKSKGRWGRVATYCRLSGSGLSHQPVERGEREHVDGFSTPHTR